MSGNTFGTIFKVTTFGESHGKALGAIIKKTQMRLIDSNKQSQELSEDLKALIKIIESGKEANSQMLSMVKKMRQNLKRLSFGD